MIHWSQVTVEKILVTESRTAGGVRTIQKNVSDNKGEVAKPCLPVVRVGRGRKRPRAKVLGM